MSESEEKLDRTTDTIIAVFRDAVTASRIWGGAIDYDAIAIQVRRLLRDECAELWEIKDVTPAERAVLDATVSCVASKGSVFSRDDVSWELIEALEAIARERRGGGDGHD